MMPLINVLQGLLWEKLSVWSNRN